MKHYIYCLRLDDVPFYIGYTNRDINQRLKEHIKRAVSPTLKEKYNRAIRNEPSMKDQYILAGIEDSIPLTIEIVAEAEWNEPLDEEWYINHYKSEGFPITNIAKGSVFKY